MRYAIVFGLLAVGLAVLAVRHGGACWLLCWPALSFLLLGAGYAGLGPGVCGKRADGRLAWWAVLLMLPYLALSWLIWRVEVLLSREPCCSEVAPGLWIGRRAFAHELPPGTRLVVDLTAEFPEPRGVHRGRDYLCLPTLDATAPDEQALRTVVARTAACPGTVYIHCAMGHGRSALVAAAVLLARGQAPDVRQALATVRRARPSVRLKSGQRRLLERLIDPPPTASAG